MRIVLDTNVLVSGLLSAAGGALAGYDETLRSTWAGTAFALAYAVIRLPATDWQGGFPRVTMEVEGRKVYDPRTATTAYSANPALCLADFLVSPIYGRGASVDWTSFGTLADYLDEAFADGARYELHMAIGGTERPQRTAEWVDVLREYARCWLDYEDGTYRAVMDAPATATGSIQPDNGGNASVLELAGDP